MTQFPERWPVKWTVEFIMRTRKDREDCLYVRRSNRQGMYSYPPRSIRLSNMSWTTVEISPTSPRRWYSAIWARVVALVAWAWGMCKRLVGRKSSIPEI